MNKFTKIFLIIISTILSLAYFISGYIFFNLIFYTRSIQDQEIFQRNLVHHTHLMNNISLAKSTELDMFLQAINKNNKLDKHELIKEKLSLYDFLNSYNNIEELNITSFDNLNLKGYLLKNNIENNNKFIVIVHPYKGSYLDVLLVSFEFYKLGFNCLLLDVRGHGNSEGSYITLVDKERKDIRDWVSYIAKRYPQSEIITYGMSMGASIVLTASSEKMPDNYKLCIADCPFNSINEVLYNVGKYIMKIPSILLPFLLSSINIFDNIINGSSIYFSVANTLEKSKVPILFIHGDKDYFIPSFNSEYMYNNYKKDKEILIVKDAGHCESCFKDKKNYYNKIKEFCNKYLNK